MFWGALTVFAVELPPECDFWRPPQKKLIEFSWNSPTTDYLREHIREIEEKTPYQGLGLYVEAPGEWQGKKFTCTRGTIFSPIPWKYEWFAKAIDDLKNTEFHTLTDNFFRTNSCPGNIDWFSDDDMATVCNNFRIAARVAREGGLKGLSLDIEGYEAPLFIYDPDWGHSLEETRRMVRLRGRQWAEAVFGEYPNMVLFCFFWLSDAYPKYLDIGRPGDPTLTPYFINGVYDVLPPTARIIDGHESMGYSAHCMENFLQIRQDLNYALRRMIDKGNVEKALRQTQVAHAFYLDPYFINSGGWASNLEWKEHPDRAKYFVRNLRFAMECTEEYMWTWGECGSWWRSVPEKGREKQAIGGVYSWEERTPGITAMIREAMQPVEVLEAKLKAAAVSMNSGDNLLANSSFETSGEKNNAIPSWDFWHMKSKEYQTQWGWSKDEGINGTGCAFLQDSASGCWIQGHDVDDGEIYYVRARAKFDEALLTPKRLPREKNGGLFKWEVRVAPTVFIRVRWQDREKRWNNVQLDRFFTFGPPQEDGWRTAEGIVSVPANSNILSILLLCNNIKGRVLFDDVTLMRK